MVGGAATRRRLFREFREQLQTSDVHRSRRSGARPNEAPGGSSMVIGVAHLQPLVAILAGILILLVPRILNYVIALYLIIVGIIGLGILR
jgi:hypothetical protein